LSVTVSTYVAPNSDTVIPAPFNHQLNKRECQL